MNIAILIPTLSRGGAERASQILGNHFVEKGNNVYYFIGETTMQQDFPVKGKVINTNIKCCTLNNELGDIQGIIKLFISSIKIRKMKSKYKIDVAISFMEEFNYLNILSKGKEKVIVRVGTILSKRQDFNSFLYKRNIVKFLYSKADKVIVLSEYSLRDMKNYYGVPSKAFFKIPNAVVDREWQENVLPWKFGEKVVVCVGRLEPVKQQDRIIRAFSYVFEKEKQAKLLILGKGSQLNYLKNLCKRYKVENNVVFVGFTNNVSYYLQHARAYVMASKVEGFSNSMIEAMNYGVPVITTNSPGACREIIGRSNDDVGNQGFVFCKYGILTPTMPDEKLKVSSKLTEQEKILGEAVFKVLSDNSIYDAYHIQSYKRATMFHIDKIAERWDNLIKQCKKN